MSEPTRITQQELNDRLFAALARARTRGVLEAIDAGADVNAIDSRTAVKNMPLHVASLNLWSESCYLLMRHGADRYAKNARGRLPKDLDIEAKIDWDYLVSFTEKILHRPSADKLLTPEGKATEAFLELCGAHKIDVALNALLRPSQWRGRETSALALRSKLSQAMPPYWAQRYGNCIDLAALRRQAAATASQPNSAVARYLAESSVNKTQR